MLHTAVDRAVERVRRIHRVANRQLANPLPAVPVRAVAVGHRVMLVAGYGGRTGPLVVPAFATLALYFMGHSFLRSIAFTVWVLAFVAAAMFYPQAFGTWFSGSRLALDLKVLIVPLIQIIMFGMGTTLSGKDFLRVFTMPWPVLIGLVLQFTVMPLAGLCIAATFGFEARDCGRGRSHRFLSGGRCLELDDLPCRGTWPFP